MRNEVIEESKALIELLDIPYFVTAMSKGGISERLKGKFGGVYSGGASTEGVRSAVENSGLILFIGYYPVPTSCLFEKIYANGSGCLE